MNISKTNAARLLETMGIPYTLHKVNVDENDLSALTLAQALNVLPETVFKTLVARGDKHGVLLACIPAAQELDLKRLAHASGNKNTSMVPLKEVLPLTGYIRHKKRDMHPSRLSYNNVKSYCPSNSAS